MNLSVQDLSRLEVASRVLVSPLVASDPQSWLAEAGEAVRDAVGGSAVVLQMPPGPGNTAFFSLDAAEVATGSLAFLQAFTTDALYFTDPVVNVWHHLRRARQFNVFSWDENMRMVMEQGLNPDDSPIVKEVLEGNRFFDFTGMIGDLPGGETMIWVLQNRRDSFRLKEQTTDLLRVLHPAFKAGLAHLAQFGARHAALDVMDEPVALFSTDGRELHRNPALERLLGSDAHRAAVDTRMARMGRTMSAHARQRPVGLPAFPAEQVETPQGTYTLRASLLPAGSFGPEQAVLVSVQSSATPALPAPDDVRQRFGLTRREAEVALLLAEGLSNAQMAERLFVSPHTARHHVENVMGKLEVVSRAAVATRLIGAA